MIRQVIGDTSAIVAILRQNERHHEWAKNKLLELPKPILTCEAVIAEACFLLGGHRNGQAAVLARVAEGILSIEFSLGGEIDRVRELMNKYADVPMSLADACLVRMCEILDSSAVFTLDSDFQVYRRHGRQMIPTIMPNAA
ncbi:MAG: type II toxin-antitoxin system VapC family toxin [Pyrinomonadaceae bacterium]